MLHIEEIDDLLSRYPDLSKVGMPQFCWILLVASMIAILSPRANGSLMNKNEIDPH